MRWPDYAVWWQVYPLGFLGAERGALPRGEPPLHRLPALEDWLDYLLALGCNGLALGPVFAAETHGYDTVDHFRVDPRLGTEEDLVRLVETAAARGVRVLLDGVFNHVGRSFPAFADVVRSGAASPYADWFVPQHPADPEQPADPADPAHSAHPEGVTFRTFEGHDHLVALNHDSPAVADHVAAVLEYWLPGESPAGGSTPPTRSRAPSGAPSPTGRGTGTRGPGSAARSSTATTRRTSPRAVWTPSPSTSCGRRSGAGSTTATSTSWPGR